MTDYVIYADRLYTQAITDPEVNSLREDEMARYIRQEAEKLCLDWREVLQACGSIQPYVVDLQKASKLVKDEDYLIRSRP